MVSSTATVETTKAVRFMKALCNHLNRKSTAEYEGHHGSITFAYGQCELNASDTFLAIHAQADNEEGLDRVRNVIDRHLLRFAGDDALEILWESPIAEDNE